MKQLVHILAALSLVASSASIVATPAWSRGLNQLQPSKPSPTAEKPVNPTNEKNPLPAPDTPQPPESPAKTDVELIKIAEQDAEKPPLKIDDRFFLGTSLAWASLSADKGGWHAGFTSDLVAGYRVAKLMKNRLWLYGTVRYLPIDVVVKYQSLQYRGIVENYLFGTLANYRQGKVIYQAGVELGVTNSKIYPLEFYEKDRSLEKSGVNLTISTGMTYSPWDGIHLGGRLFLGAGTFTSIQTAANVSFSL